MGVKLSSVALTSLERVYDYLGRDASSGRDDAILLETINAVSAWCERYCGRNFLSRTYTHDGTTLPRLTGDGSSTIFLRNYPVTAVSSLKLWPNQTALTEGWDEDFVVDKWHGVIRLLWRRTFRWPESLEVTYTGGYIQATQPYDASELEFGWESAGQDIELSIVKQVAEMYHRKTRQRDGLVSQSVEGVSSTFTEKALLADVKKVWDSVREWRH